MAKKKAKKRSMKSSGKKSDKKSSKKSKVSKEDIKKFPTLKLKKESDIAMDFATKAYKKFDKLIKAVVLFGSTVKQTQVAGSDIDIIIIIDDVMVVWDQELIAWYREELEKILKTNPYQSALHINTVKVSSWWEDLMVGDPTVMNILRYGEPMIDMAGFFDPIKGLLLKGKIKSTPEAIYSALQRAPLHLARSREAELSSIEGVFWSMVDSAQAALMAANIPPASPEHIAGDLKVNFVDAGKLKMKYVVWYHDLLKLHKDISHGQIKDMKGLEIDAWQQRADEFMNVMAQIVNDIFG